MNAMKNIMRVVTWERYFLAHMAVFPLLVLLKHLLNNSLVHELLLHELLNFILVTVILHWFFTPAYVPDKSRTHREIRFFVIQAIFFNAVVFYESADARIIIFQVLLAIAILAHWRYRYECSYWKFYPSFLKTIDTAGVERISILNKIKEQDEIRENTYGILSGSIETPENISTDEVYENYIASLEALKNLLVELDECSGFYTEYEKFYWLGYVMYQCGVGCSRIHDPEQAEKFLKPALEYLTEFEEYVPYGNEDFAQIVSLVCNQGYLSALQIVPSLAVVIGENEQRQDEEKELYESLINEYVPNYEGFPYIQAGAYRKVGQYYMYQNFDLGRARDCFREGIAILERYTSLEESLQVGSTIMLEMKDLLANIGEGEESETIRQEIEQYQHLNTWSQTINLKNE